MSDRIPLVQGDTRPFIVLTIKDAATDAPIDLSSPLTEVRLKLRPSGSQDTKAVLNCVKVPGLTMDDIVVLAAPYNVPGIGGRCLVQWTSASLDTAGYFEGEIEVLFPDGSRETIYEVLKFKVRPQF